MLKIMTRRKYENELRERDKVIIDTQINEEAVTDLYYEELEKNREFIKELIDLRSDNIKQRIELREFYEKGMKANNIFLDTELQMTDTVKLNKIMDILNN